MHADYDLVILGGGCAGLSLAARLAQAPRKKLRVLLLEAREGYSNDRTWCFWAPARHEFSDLVTHRWRAWRFSGPGENHLHRASGDLSYQCLAAPGFYQSMLDLIALDPDIDMRMGVEVGMASSHGTCVLIDTDAGSITARWVVDTRPVQTAGNGPAEFAQVFTGIEVETDNDVFDPSCVGLMQNMSCDDQGFRFTYLLPFSPRHALIEETRFTTDVERERLEQDLYASISQLNGVANYRILRREQGRIPMAVGHGSRDRIGQVWHAGTAGGAVRPSTGYAFLRIQRWARACAAQLALNLPPLAHPRDPAWRRAVDALFLQVIENRPSLAPTLFLAMARGVEADALVRFLSDEGRPLDFVQVASALPKRPFLSGLTGSKWLQAVT